MDCLPFLMCKLLHILCCLPRYLAVWYNIHFYLYVCNRKVSQFEPQSWPCYQLSSLRFVVLSLSKYSGLPSWYPETGHDRLLRNPYLFIMYDHFRFHPPSWSSWITRISQWSDESKFVFAWVSGDTPHELLMNSLVKLECIEVVSYTPSNSWHCPGERIATSVRGPSHSGERDYFFEKLVLLQGRVEFRLLQ
jgi:hypothetical protein